MGDNEGDAGGGPPAHSPLMQASIRGDLEAISRLVASGADVDQVNAKQETALTYAIVWNQVDALELLLESGADPNVPEKSPWSPLMYAANEGNQTMVGALLRRGADRQRRDDHGRSASDIARAQGFETVARLAGGG